MQIDATDTQLLTLLRDNAHTPVTELARTLGLARTTVQARIERLEDAGVIAGYTLAFQCRHPPGPMYHGAGVDRAAQRACGAGAVA